MKRYLKAAAYGAVRVLDSDQPAAVLALLDFLLSEDAQAILADFGFVPPPEPATTN